MPQPAEAVMAAHRAYGAGRWFGALADRRAAKGVAPVMAAEDIAPEDDSAHHHRSASRESRRRRGVFAKHSPHGRVMPPRSVRRRWLNIVVAVLVVVAALIEIRLYVVPASDGARPADAVVVLGGQAYQARLQAADAMLKKYPGSVVVV